jgi:hypothetical protein
MLDARVGQHAFVINLPRDEDSCHRHRDQAQNEQQPFAEISQPTRDADLVDSENPEKRTIEQSAREQR